MKCKKLFFIALLISSTAHMQCMVMDLDPRLMDRIETITKILENLSQQIAPTTQKLGIGSLGFLATWNGLSLMHNGIYRTIDNDEKKFNQQKYQDIWFTPERQKGILMCTFGLAFFGTGGYTLLKPGKVIDYFYT